MRWKLFNKIRDKIISGLFTSLKANCSKKCRRKHRKRRRLVIVLLHVDNLFLGHSDKVLVIAKFWSFVLIRPILDKYVNIQIFRHHAWLGSLKAFSIAITDERCISNSFDMIYTFASPIQLCNKSLSNNYEKFKINQDKELHGMV